MRDAKTSHGEVLRDVLESTWVDALLKLGFTRGGVSFRRTTARGIEIVRLGRHPYFQAHLFVAPRSAGTRTNAALAKRVATKSGRAFVAGRNDESMATLADLIYPDDISPPTQAGARAVAAKQIRAAKKKWLRRSC